MFKFRFFFLFSLIFLSNSIFATVRYVKTNGSGDGSSWGNAPSDLQAVINNSSSGDEIWVAAGTYKPNRRADTGASSTTDPNNAFVLKSGVKIYGGFTGTETLLSQRNWITNVTILTGDLGTVGNASDNAYHVVVSAGVDGTAELNGFTISNGNANADATITVNSKTITSSWGGGVFCISSSPTLTNLIIQYNSAKYYGGGMYILDSSPIITNTTIDSNTGGQRGGGIYNSGSNPVILNSTIKNNIATSEKGGGICNNSSSPTITNTLIFKNSSNQNGGAIFNENSSTPVITNATIVYNSTNFTYAPGGIDGSCTVNNSIIWGNMAGGMSSNVSSGITYNYCLLENGTVSGNIIISNANPRFIGVSVDNYRLNGWSPAVNVGSNTLYTSTSTVDLDGNTRKYGIIDLGAYEYQSSNTSLPAKTETIYVKKGSTGDGTSWTSAFGELSDALQKSDEIGTVVQIWVAAGTYYPRQFAGTGTTNAEKSFVMQKDVKIYGGFAGGETSASQRNWRTNSTILTGNMGGSGTAYHVVISSGDAGTSELNGFTITGGNASNWGSLTVNSNSIGWQSGGGIYCNSSSPILSSLIVYSNSSINYGAGIYCTTNSNPVINNTLIYKNTPGQGYGGIVSENSSTPILTNCTIVNNTGGGINGNFTVNNSIIWGNSNNVSGTITYNYCLLEGGTLSGNGIIRNINPSFVNSTSDNYRLQSSSPAKDVGNDTYVSSIPYDLDNYPRIYGSHTDLGAYECIVINKWQGTTSTDSETGSNWSSGTVLAPNEYLEFDTNAQRDMVLGADHSVGSITIQSNSSRLIDLNGKKLTVKGMVSLGSTASISAGATGSTITFAGTFSQAIPSSLFYNNSVYNLTISNPSNVTFDGTLKLLNALTATSGKLDAMTNWPTISYAGVSAQSIDPNLFLNDQAYNLTVDNAAGVTVNTDFTVNNLLTINTGKLLTIPVSKKLNVIGSITNNAGASGLVIKSGVGVANGTLIFHNVVGNPVFATVEMYSKAAATYTSPYSGYKWQFFGIPLRTLTAQDAFSGSYVRQYYEPGLTSSASWISLTSTDNLNSFKGYEVTQAVAKTIIFQGVLENSDMNCNLTYTSNSWNKGYHIISNPYTAAIDITQLNFTNMDAIVYLYNTGSHADWISNSGSTSPSGSPGQYVASTKNTAGTGGIPAQIPSMQGFMVSAYSSGGNLSIPYNSIALKNTDVQRVKQSTPDNKIYTIVDVNGLRYSDKMWLFTDDACTHNFDNGWDGYKILGSTSAPQIYAMESDGNYQINSVDNINNTYVGFQTGEDSEYTMTFTHQNFDSKYTTLYLTDLLTNKSIDISLSGSTYTFTSDAGSTLEKRFKITTSVDVHTQLDQTTINPLALKVYNLNQTICVANNTPQSGELTIYDMTGKVVTKSQFSANNVTRIKTNIKSGYYLARARTLTDSSIVKLFIP